MPVWLIVFLVSIVVYAISFILIRTISRYREYAADRGSALITGAPEHLMSALQKISSGITQIPQRDLREVAGDERLLHHPDRTGRRTMSEWMMDHPPLEKRLAALAEIAREMGRPVASEPRPAAARQIGSGLGAVRATALRSRRSDGAGQRSTPAALRLEDRAASRRGASRRHRAALLRRVLAASTRRRAADQAGGSSGSSSALELTRSVLRVVVTTDHVLEAEIQYTGCRRRTRSVEANAAASSCPPKPCSSSSDARRARRRPGSSSCGSRTITH